MDDDEPGWAGPTRVERGLAIATIVACAVVIYLSVDALRPPRQEAEDEHASP